jgi:hypothetical protein
MGRILRGLSSKLLRCGCLLGVYETYEGAIVGLIDAKAAGCTIVSHDGGNVLPVPHIEEEHRDTQAENEN